MEEKSGLTPEIIKTVRLLWRDPSFSGSFGGIATFRDALSLEKNIHLTRDQILKIFKSDEDFILNTHRVSRRIKRRKYVVSGYGELFQADLAIMPKIEDKIGFLLCIDAFSRRTFCRLLKSKTAKEVQLKLKDIFKEAGVIPQKLESDQGGEFVGNQKIFEKNGILFKRKVGNNKAAFAECRIRTGKPFTYINQLKVNHVFFSQDKTLPLV